MDAENDLTSKIKEWLLSTGAPLEMSVARTLQLRGLDVQQSVYFEDPDSGTLREIDVIGTRAIRVTDKVTVAAIAVLECKFAPTPWVIYRGSPAYDQERPNYDRILTQHGKKWLSLLAPHPAVHLAKMIQQEPRAGYALGTSAPGRDGSKAQPDAPKDLAYIALSSVTKAAGSYARTLDEDPARTTIAILFPIIVIRGKLFETWFDGEDLVVQPIRRGQILWRHVPGQTPALVDVVTEDAFEGFADGLQESAIDIVFQGKEAAERMDLRSVW
jgi:hypothetical protein